MSDGIVKGVGEQLGKLGSDIVSEVAKTPAKLAGMDQGTQEVKGSGGSGKQQSSSSSAHNSQPSEQIDPLAIIRQKDEVEKQKGLQAARQLLQQFSTPHNAPQPTRKEELELEELEKQKAEIKAQQEQARQTLQSTGSKKPRGDLYGIKAKKFAGEQGKNVVSQ